MPFPLTPRPAHYVTTTMSTRGGIYYVGDTVSVTFNVSGPDAYEVRDYWGTVVASGVASGTSLSLGSSWDPGWYRVYLTGTETDAVFGDSYGAACFIVIRSDSRFVTNPAIGTGAGQGGGEAKDLVGKGVLGIGSSRIQISDASAPTTGTDPLATAELAATLGNTYWRTPGAQYEDAVRPARQMMLQFPNRTYDRIEYAGGNPGFRVFIAAPTVNGSNVYIQVEAGSVSGAKYTVRAPDSTTIVETYDNIANATALITASAASAYIKVFGAGANPSPTGPTAIGSAYKDGVTTVVAALYPDGVTHFEGPVNEPDPGSTSLPHAMWLFQDAVHDGHASAKAIGPCAVEINDHYLADWDLFFTNGGGDYCDEITFHAYNAQTNGDINLARHVFEGFLQLLVDHGQDAKPLWCTESTHVMTSIYGWDPAHNNGTFHPRRSRVPLLQTLLMEQYGIPRERNHVWYDYSHGFWSYPTWLWLSGGSPVPYAAMYRTLAEETFEMAHSQILDFGNAAANGIFLGSVYQEPSGPGCAVLVAQSYMPGASVTLQVTGTSSPLTVVDAWGNETTANITDGLATIDVADIPTYVQLPTGVTVAVDSVNDWGPGARTNVASGATTKTVGATTVAEIADDAFMTNYGLRTGVHISSGALPENATLIWTATKTVDLVVVWSGVVWQDSAALVDFDVETWNGSTWTTQETVTRTSPSSFLFGTDSTNAGTKVETYWDEQWIFPVKFAAPVECLGVRLVVRETSYGGEPDAAAIDAGGQGSTTQRIALQEIMALEPSAEVAPTSSSAFSRAGITAGAGGSAFVRFGGG